MLVASSTGSADGAPTTGSADGAPDPKTKRTLRAQSSVCPDKYEELLAKTSSQKVEAATFKTLEGIVELAKEHVKAFKDIMRSGGPRNFGPGRTLTVATACTGSGLDIIVLAACQAALEEESPGTKFKYLFNCEIQEKKRNWIMELHRNFGRHLNGSASGDGKGNDDGDDDDVPCCFLDIMDLKNKQAHCVVHEKMCPVQRADIGFICTSCKDFSSQNPKKIKGKKVFDQKATSGGSAQTMHGMLD